MPYACISLACPSLKSTDLDGMWQTDVKVPQVTSLTNFWEFCSGGTVSKTNQVGLKVCMKPRKVNLYNNLWYETYITLYAVCDVDEAFLVSMKLETFRFLTATRLYQGSQHSPHRRIYCVLALLQSQKRRQFRCSTIPNFAPGTFDASTW